MKTIEPVCTIEPTSAAARQPAPKIRPTATAHASTKIRGHHLERLALVYIRLPGATQNLDVLWVFWINCRPWCGDHLTGFGSFGTICVHLDSYHSNVPV